MCSLLSSRSPPLLLARVLIGEERPYAYFSASSGERQ
jgi:hypothetical protein